MTRGRILWIDDVSVVSGYSIFRNRNYPYPIDNINAIVAWVLIMLFGSHSASTHNIFLTSQTYRFSFERRCRNELASRALWWYGK